MRKIAYSVRPSEGTWLESFRVILACSLACDPRAFIFSLTVKQKSFESSLEQENVTIPISHKSSNIFRGLIDKDIITGIYSAKTVAQVQW